MPALIATVDQVAGVAMVSVRGELDRVSCARLQDRLAWAAENAPRRLVLELAVSDCSAEQILTLIAATRERLWPGCQLEVRAIGTDSATPIENRQEQKAQPAFGAVQPPAR